MNFKILVTVIYLTSAIYCTFGLPVQGFNSEYPEFGRHFEGDIIINSPGLLAKSGITGTERRWPGNTLVYNIGSGFSSNEQQLILSALRELQSKTCIKFVPGNRGDYVEFTKVSSGCASSVGKVGGLQRIQLASMCFGVGHGTVMHEVIHALGFFHEQSRRDRDDFVVLHYDKIQPGAENNFNKEMNTNEYSVPYDYNSIMHYPKTAFGKRAGDITIEVKQRGAVIGQRQYLSPSDILKVNRMYGC